MQLEQCLLRCVVCVCVVIIFLTYFVLYMHPAKIGYPITLDVPRRIDYTMSMDKITKYRLSTYLSGVRYKWLFLTTYQMYRSMMHRHYFSQYYAAKRHSSIDPTLWGTGFPG